MLYAYKPTSWEGGNGGGGGIKERGGGELGAIRSFEVKFILIIHHA